MRAALAGFVALVGLAACETFEPYSVEYDEVINEQGVLVYGNLMEDISGSRWWQFTGSNGGTRPACVQTRITNGNTNGHSMGATYLLAPGETIDIGYVTLPASFNTNTQVWDPAEDGQCGYPPNP